AQLKKIHRRTKAWLFHHPPNGTRVHAVEARLHEPDLPYIGDESTLYRHFARLFVQHGVRRLQQSLGRMASFLYQGLPTLANQFPQQGGKQKAWADGLACTYPDVGSSQRQVDEVFPFWNVEDYVEQGHEVLMQTDLAQLAQAVHGMTAGKQLHGFVKEARRGNVFDKRSQPVYGFQCLGLNRRRQLGSEAHSAQH